MIWVIPLIIIAELVISSLLGLALRNPSYGSTIYVSVLCLFFLGTVVHEAAHRLFCAIFGVKVRETRFFIKPDRKKIERGEGITLGYVSPEKIDSFIVSFFIGVAPLIINGLIVALICYYFPVLIETSFYGLIIYLLIALASAAKPSGPDIKNISHAFKRAPGRNFFELFMLLVFAGVLCALFACEVELWIGLTAAVIFFLLLVRQGRANAGGPKTPKWRV